VRILCEFLPRSPLVRRFDPDAGVVTPNGGVQRKGDTMRKTLAAATLAVSVAVGGAAGAALGGPTLAGAADTATGAVGWVQDALSGLVDDGTITEEQAEAVESALEEARPARGFGHARHLSTVADALGISEDDLRTALGNGQTLAEVAESEGVDVQAVIDAIVAAHEEHLAAAVANGRLTQDEADELLADAEERATAIVNGEVRPFRRGPFGHRHRFDRLGDDSADSTDTTDESETSDAA
jgi:uncharacterized protein YidB (DUF937 family)